MCCERQCLLSEWELLPVFWSNKLILRHVWSVLVVWVSFGGEINCLAKMHIGSADCVERFEKVALVLTNACYNWKKPNTVYFKHTRLAHTFSHLLTQLLTHSLSLCSLPSQHKTWQTPCLHPSIAGQKELFFFSLRVSVIWLCWGPVSMWFRLQLRSHNHLICSVPRLRWCESNVAEFGCKAWL